MIFIHILPSFVIALQEKECCNKNNNLALQPLKSSAEMLYQSYTVSYPIFEETDVFNTSKRVINLYTYMYMFTSRPSSPTISFLCDRFIKPFFMFSGEYMSRSRSYLDSSGRPSRMLGDNSSGSTYAKSLQKYFKTFRQLTTIHLKDTHMSLKRHTS